MGHLGLRRFALGVGLAATTLIGAISGCLVDLEEVVSCEDGVFDRATEECDPSVAPEHWGLQCENGLRARPLASDCNPEGCFLHRSVEEICACGNSVIDENEDCDVASPLEVKQESYEKACRVACGKTLLDEEWDFSCNLPCTDRCRFPVNDPTELSQGVGVDKVEIGCCAMSGSRCDAGDPVLGCCGADQCVDGFCVPPPPFSGD